MLESLDTPAIQAELFKLSESRETFPPGSARGELLLRHAEKLTVNPFLTRQLVSFQANKEIPFYRWLRYKEAFSSRLVEYLLSLVRPRHDAHFSVLDPFAGAGTTLTTAAQLGCRATGIEILPVGVAATQARLKGQKVKQEAFQHCLHTLQSRSLGDIASQSYRFPHLNITRGAFPDETEKAISSFVGFVESIEDPDVRYLFWFACLSILEEVSYTRKDGQYLRWDSRSGRALRSRFNKGTIHEFRSALFGKLQHMLEDVRYRGSTKRAGLVQIVEGSCLDELPKLPANSFDCVITSPPYANRYDYTRTYALELAFMGHDGGAVKRLRQALLSCTVENRSKRDQLSAAYADTGRQDIYAAALKAFESQEAVHEVLGILYDARDKRLLNNSNIPNLVQNYFFEMNLVVWELARVLKPGGSVFMVNDNVRYYGEEVPVDLVLSDFAATAGLDVENIWVLPRGKGNSSQQMGKHGRSELRKCIYWWRKPLDS